MEIRLLLKTFFSESALSRPGKRVLFGVVESIQQKVLNENIEGGVKQISVKKAGSACFIFPTRRLILCGEQRRLQPYSAKYLFAVRFFLLYQVFYNTQSVLTQTMQRPVPYTTTSH
jgi:hypothetical protein